MSTHPDERPPRSWGHQPPPQSQPASYQGDRGQQGHQDQGYRQPPPEYGYTHQGHYPPSPPQPHPQPQRPEPRNGFGLTALILGLAGIIPGLIPLTWGFAAILAITGLVFGIVGIGRVRRRVATNRKTTYAGVVISALVLALSIWGASLFFGAFDQLDRDLENLGGAPVDAAAAGDAVAPGTLVQVGDWRVAVAASNLDAAAAVAAANSFNDPPPEGHQMVMARADVAYAGAESGTPWLDLQFRILGGRGNTFDTGNADCGVIPASLTDVGEMAPGATGAGNVCIMVPSDQLEGAVWVVDANLPSSGDGQNRAVVALQ